MGKILKDFLNKSVSSALMTIALFVPLGLVYSFTAWNWSIFAIVKDEHFWSLVRAVFLFFIVLQYIIEKFKKA